ncbi:MAG: class I SAM-dependent methyltransferase [Acidiferrobacterales bacterium]
MDPARTDAGSFRDPSGRVYVVDGRVFRTVMPSAVEDFEFVRSTGFLERLIDDGRVVAEKKVDPGALGQCAQGARYVLEHPMLPFVSYPYEWPFAALKAAALLQLDIHLEALDHGVTLSDATAYNIQFRGVEPVFIDSLSFRRYREGEFWIAHRQFCEQFVNPLLLRALLGIPHNSWYRGTLEGITAQDLSRILPWTRKFSWNVLTHVVLQARFQKKSTGRDDAERRVKEKTLPLIALRQMLRGLRKWILKLEPADTGKTVWADYARDNSYASDEAQAKRQFVSEFAAATKPKMLWDIGCNTGDYSKAALEAGAEFVVGFDFDQGALDAAFTRARAEHLDFLPLFLDAANPPPNQGWGQTERMGLMQRADGDGMLALAVVHHLAIGKNVPLGDVVDWLVSIAPTGIIEFVQKSDPMVQTLLRLREDIFDDYNEQSFVSALEARATIVKSVAVSAAERRLYWFRRR